MPDMLMGDDRDEGTPPRVTDEQIAEWERLAGAAGPGLKQNDPADLARHLAWLEGATSQGWQFAQTYAPRDIAMLIRVEMAAMALPEALKALREARALLDRLEGPLGRHEAMFRALATGVSVSIDHRSPDAEIARIDALDLSRSSAEIRAFLGSRE